MDKRKIIITFLIMILVNAMLLAIYNESSSFRNIGSSFIFIALLIAVPVALYYLKFNNKPPQFASAPLKSDKNEKNSDGSQKNIIGFKDVAGLEEVKEELGEIIDFLKYPDKYRQMGAVIPKGILLHGPPGTGKTLLARAIAGETNSKFIPASGSEFVEKYVGVGAKRVRTLFEKARKEPSAVIFIDEIDAIGAKRTIESNNEKDQTLNQLLIEMDGFNNDSAVIIVGATNRIDMLDEALKRPGRFDRNVFIGTPDFKSREEIFKVHVKNKPISPTIDLKELARKTHGMTGAHICNIANEAAILAVRENRKVINTEDFSEAIEKVIGGLKRKSLELIENEKRRVSHHEAGHALVGKILSTDLITKISIVPRSQALGYVMYTPEEERFLLTKEDLSNKIKVMLGGRAAEQLVFGSISTGAMDDLKKANQLAYQMVCEYGMSDLEHRYFDPMFLRNCYETIDKEISKIIKNCYQDAIKTLENNKELLCLIASNLYDKEILTSQDLEDILVNYENEII